MTTTTRYLELTVSGSPRELGRAIGEGARTQVRGFCEMALERVRKTVAISDDQAYAVAEASLPFVEQYSPDLIEELRGTAEAADVRLLDLMLLQVRNQLQSRDNGCTSLSLGSGAECMVGQNWDNDPALDEFTIVLTRRPEGKPSLMSVTQAGLIAYIGLNDRGIGACLNTLPAPSREVGTPHYFTLRRLYEADSLDGAVEAIRSARRAIPANIMLATPQGPADLEVTTDQVYVLHDPVAVTHTNHCQHPDIVGYNEQFPELIQSHPRKQRIDSLVAQWDGQFETRHLMAALSDHQDHPRSICRHANNDPDTGFWQTVFSVVIKPNEGRMYVSRGTPCNHPYEAYELA